MKNKTIKESKNVTLLITIFYGIQAIYNLPSIVGAEL